MWFTLALLSAVFSAFRRLGEKRLSQNLSAFTMSWALQLASLPVIFIVWVLSGESVALSSLGLSFWAPTAAVLLGFYPLSGYLYHSAIRHGELTRTLPLQSLGPVFSLVLSIIFTQYRPDATGLIGMAIIVCGIYVAGLKGKQLHNPLRALKGDRASLHTIYNVGLIALVGLLDVMAIKASAPAFYALVSTVGAVPVLILTARIAKASDARSVLSNWKPIVYCGGLLGASYASYSLALAVGPLSYVNALRTSGVLVIGAALGVVLLHERLTRQKMATILLVLIGAILLALSG